MRTGPKAKLNNPCRSRTSGENCQKNCAKQNTIPVGAANVLGQEVGQLDSTGMVPEPTKVVATRSGVSSGVAVPDQWHIGQLKLQIMNLDKDYYRPGEKVSFELRLTNPGTQPVVIPWSLQRAEVELANVSSFDFLSAWCSLGVPSGTFTRTVLRGGIFLYGNDLHPNSLLRLRPGEWATLRGRAVMLRDSHDAGAAETNNWTAELQATCSISLNRVHVNGKEIWEFAYPVEAGELRSASKNIKLEPSQQ